MRDVQQIVDFGKFLFLFRCLPDFNGLSLDGFHAGSDHHLCSRNSPYLLPPDAGVSLLLQAVHGDGDYPVGQHGQIQVRLKEKGVIRRVGEDKMAIGKCY